MSVLKNNNGNRFHILLIHHFPVNLFELFTLRLIFQVVGGERREQELYFDPLIFEDKPL